MLFLFFCLNSFHTVAVRDSLAFDFLGCSWSRESSGNLITVQNNPVAITL